MEEHQDSSLYKRGMTFTYGLSQTDRACPMFLSSAYLIFPGNFNML